LKGKASGLRHGAVDRDGFSGAAVAPVEVDTSPAGFLRWRGAILINPDKTSAVLLEVDERKVASVILNRPTVNNAYDGDFIQCMLAAIDALDKVAGLRAVVVKGKGRHFQAGADLNWLNAVRISSPEENIRASRATAEAVQRLNLAAAPTVALVQGACFGGGTGILAACDVVIAADDAIFSIAEVGGG
jgi:methylglutaconyl-CoA hydratase